MNKYIIACAVIICVVSGLFAFRYYANNHFEIIRQNVDADIAVSGDRVVVRRFVLIRKLTMDIESYAVVVEKNGSETARVQVSSVFQEGSSEPMVEERGISDLRYSWRKSVIHVNMLKGDIRVVTKGDDWGLIMKKIGNVGVVDGG